MDNKVDQMAQDELSDKNYARFGEYNNEMIRLSHSKITRHKNLTHYVKLSKIFGGNWGNITEKDVKRIVGTIMIKRKSQYFLC